MCYQSTKLMEMSLWVCSNLPMLWRKLRVYQIALVFVSRCDKLCAFLLRAIAILWWWCAWQQQNRRRWATSSTVSGQCWQWGILLCPMRCRCWFRVHVLYGVVSVGWFGCRRVHWCSLCRFLRGEMGWWPWFSCSILSASTIWQCPSSCRAWCIALWRRHCQGSPILGACMLLWDCRIAGLQGKPWMCLSSHLVKEATNLPLHPERNDPRKCYVQGNGAWAKLPCPISMMTYHLMQQHESCLLGIVLSPRKGSQWQNASGGHMVHERTHSIFQEWWMK